jgi:cytochrome c biogenesis protein CcmG/thiol:disulfide interchange protein DsbE
MKRPAVAALLVLALWSAFLSAAFGRGGGAGPARPPGVVAGMQAPDFTLPALDGGKVTLSALRGRPAVLNFWATWCEACRLEAPALRALQAEQGDRVALLGIDDGEPPARVRLFVARSGYTWTVLLDEGAVTAAAYGVHYLPTTVFVDPAGVIRRTYTGALTAGQLRAFLKEAATPAR